MISRGLRIGKVDKRTAENVKLHVERVVAARSSAQPVDSDTAAWLTKISWQLHERLARVGLVEPAARPQAEDVTLDAFASQYIAGRARLSERTILNLEGTQKRLVAVFGKERTLRSITPGDAEELRETLLRDDYAPSTVATDIKRARQFYKAALKKGLVTRNPFDEVKAGSQVNKSRAFFVSREVAGGVLAACPDNEWRLIFALSRFGGLLPIGDPESPLDGHRLEEGTAPHQVEEDEGPDDTPLPRVAALPCGGTRGDGGG